MFISGDFQLPDTPALAVPESVLVLRNNNRYVMMVDKDNRVHETKVEVGRRHKTDVEIVAGVDAQARLALSGGAFLNDGDLVRVAQP
jgi:multidrug efflux pump subunit AcrA (membrane-fusion protein)